MEGIGRDKLPARVRSGSRNVTWFMARGSNIVPVDDVHGLFDVQFSRFSVVADTTPIIHAIGGIGVLLDFEKKASFADGMSASSRDEHGVVFLCWNGVEN